MWRQVVIDAQPIVSVLFYIFGMIGVIVAYSSLRSNRHNQKETNARRAYLEYAGLGIQYPDFAFPRRLNIDFDAQTVNGKKEEFEQYEWFVSILLATVHFFLETVGEVGMWRQMMILQLAYHWRYLDRFRNEKEYLKRWNTELRGELDQAIGLGRRLYPETQQGAT